MSKHTPEPWKVISRILPHRLGDHIERVICTEYIDGQLHDHYPVVCQAIGIGKEGEPPVHFVSIKQEDARRIVACVNACEGIATETLETRIKYTFTDIEKENKKLQRQNAELLEALKSAVKIIETADVLIYDDGKKLMAIKSAIAKAKGGA